jgi:hypothetical protein
MLLLNFEAAFFIFVSGIFLLDDLKITEVHPSLLSVIMLSVIMLRFFMLSAIMLSVIMLSVVAPCTMQCLRADML